MAEIRKFDPAAGSAIAQALRAALGEPVREEQEPRAVPVADVQRWVTVRSIQLAPEPDAEAVRRAESGAGVQPESDAEADSDAEAVRRAESGAGVQPESDGGAESGAGEERRVGLEAEAPGVASKAGLRAKQNVPADSGAAATRAEARGEPDAASEANSER